jgi:hypothetical protein
VESAKVLLGGLLESGEIKGRREPLPDRRLKEMENAENKSQAIKLTPKNEVCDDNPMFFNIKHP